MRSVVLFSISVLISMTLSAAERLLPSQSLKVGELFTSWSEPVRRPEGTFRFKKCVDSDEYAHQTANTADGGVINLDCTPDVLYSWGGQARIDDLKTHFTSGTDASPFFARDLYLTQSATGTFAYGKYAMRFKIRPGTQFKVHRLSREGRRMSCSEKGEAEKNVIEVVPWSAGWKAQEYIICSSSVIESWSYGTREHYDEVTEELNWIHNKPMSEYALYIRDARNWYGTEGHTNPLDGHLFSRELLEVNLKVWVDLIMNGKEQIFYATDVARDRTRHFTRERILTHD